MRNDEVRVGKQHPIMMRRQVVVLGGRQIILARKKNSNRERSSITKAKFYDEKRIWLWKERFYEQSSIMAKELLSGKLDCMMLRKRYYEKKII